MNKRKFSGQKRVKNDSHRPNVSLKARVGQFLHNFRGHIARSSAREVQLCILGTLDTEAEVDDFELSTVADKYVVQLEVAVAYCFRVHEFNCAR